VDDRVSFANGQLEWTFGKPAEGALQARSLNIPPPPPAYAAAPAGGSAQRRNNGAVGFEAPRAAAYVGMAQASGTLAGGERARRVQKRYSGRKINIDIKDGDLHNILRLLAKEGNVNIVTSDDVKGTVTLHLQDVPWDQALEIILNTKGLGQVREGGIIRIDLKERLAKEREDEVTSRKTVEALKPLQIKLLSVNHADSSDLQATVKGVLSSRGDVKFDKRTNTLIIRDVDDHIEAAVDLVRRLDTQTSQVLLTARIVEVNTNDLKELGIQWGGQAISSPATGNSTGLRFPGVIGVRGGADDTQAPTGGVPTSPNFVVNLPAAAGGGSGGALGMTFGSIDGAFNLNVRLSALENRGSAKVVSQPRIATLDNVQATIKDGVRIPISQVSAAGITTQFFNADLQLQATPTVTQDGNVYLKMKVTKSTPDFQNVGARGDPTILTKEAITSLLLGDGETMVIGGIFSSNAGYSYAEVPYLGRIPILGALFRRYREDVRKSELLIFITTEIMNRRDSSVQTGP
jgi:type IV pilus assembly protein PilQ